MRERFRFLLEQTQFLQVMRRKADEMALPSHRNLQSLPDPPSCVGGQTGSMADIKPVDRLHEATDSFLEEVGVAESVMAKTLGHMRGKPDVG